MKVNDPVGGILARGGGGECDLFSDIAGCTVLVIALLSSRASPEPCPSMAVISFLHLQSESNVSILLDVQPIRRITSAECHERLTVLTLSYSSYTLS
jgi:hypothetical protein